MTRILKSISICFIILISNLVDAQIPETNPNYHAADNWVFGDSVWLQFTSDSIYSKSIDFTSREASSCFSDDTGLLYYSSPITFWNLKNNSKLGNFKGHVSSTQGSLLESTEDTINFFVSGENNHNFNNSINHYIINNLDSIVRVKKIMIASTEQLSSINHQNQKYIWVTTHLSTSNEFYTFLLKNNTTLCPVVTAIGGDYTLGTVTPQNNGYQIKFSPSGNILTAIRSDFDATANARVDLAKFDSESGKLGNNVYFRTVVPSRVCFSQFETKLYVSSNRVSQVSLESWNNSAISSSLIDVLPIQSYNISDLSISPNGTILFGIADSTFLGEIKSPDSLGSKCNIVSKSLELNYGKCKYGLPNFNASYFHTPSIDFAYTEDCWGHAYSFEGRDTLQATSWKWIFEKGSVSDSLFTKHCKYTFPDTGKWVVSHMTSTATRSDTVTKTLTIRPQWQQDALGKDTFYCTGASINLTLQAPIDMHCIHWNDEEPNLDESLGPIVDYDHFHIDTLLVDTAGTYIVKLTNKTFCQMWDTITIREYARPSKSVINRSGQELESSIVAAEYRWYFNGSLKNTTTDSKLTPDSNGYWQVQLISEYGCESELSDSFNVGFAGIDKRYETLDLRFEIYPNPSDGNITIAVPKGGDYQVKLSTIGGQLVSRGGPNFQSELYRSVNKKIELDIKLPAANYILTLTNAEGDMGSRQITIY
jgi:hypothetical protein